MIVQKITICAPHEYFSVDQIKNKMAEVMARMEAEDIYWVFWWGQLGKHLRPEQFKKNFFLECFFREDGKDIFSKKSLSNYQLMSRNNPEQRRVWVLICDNSLDKLANLKKELTPQLKGLVRHVFVSALHDKQKSFGTKRYSHI